MPFRLPKVYFIQVLYLIYHNTTEGASIRLVGRGHSYGHEEVYHNRRWVTVCDDHRARNEAKVVCHQLGYFGAGLALRSAACGEGHGPI